LFYCEIASPFRGWCVVGSKDTKNGALCVVPEAKKGQTGNGGWENTSSP
jgi:hypothetical protein